MLRLYDYQSYWLSPSARRVGIALHLEAIPFQPVPIDLFALEQREDDYRANNALQQVPLLARDEGGEERYLSQSLAIIDHLHGIQPEPALIPRDRARRTRALQLAEIVNAGLQPLQNRYVLSRLQEAGCDGQAFATHFITRGLSALETTAAQSAGAFLVGDAVTVADLFLVPRLNVARRMNVDRDAMVTLHRAEDGCLALEAFHKADPLRQAGAPSDE